MFNKFTIVLFTTILAVSMAGEILLPGSCLWRGETINSDNGCFRLTMQEDGNLVGYRRSNNHPILQSNTLGTCSNKACMQTDGNFVYYDCNNTPRWNSGTSGNPGAFLTVQGDGNLVVYSASHHPLWASNTVTHC